MKHIIYNNLHIGTLHQINVDFVFNKNTIFLGDNFEIKNCLKGKLKNIIKLKNKNPKKGFYFFVRDSGIEPLIAAWKAEVIPFN